MHTVPNAVFIADLEGAEIETKKVKHILAKCVLVLQYHSDVHAWGIQAMAIIV